MCPEMKCLNCGTVWGLVHCGGGKYMCRKCLDSLPKKRLKELGVI